MKLRRWFTLIGAVLVLGLLQVAQRNAVVLQAYGVGERLAKAHRDEADLGWLETRVAGMSSPGALASAKESRSLKFVARSTLLTPASQPPLALAQQPDDVQDE